MTVEVKSPEEIFDEYKHLAEVTIYKMFHHPDRFAQSIGMQKEDLFQLSRIGLYKGCTDFYKTEHNLSLKSFLIRNARWYVGYHIDRLTVGNRIYKSQKPTEDNLATCISMSSEPQKDQEENSTFYDIVSTDGIFNFDSVNTYPENIVMAEYGKDSIMNILKDEDKELVNLRLEKDLTLQEIADVYGISKQAISMKFKRIQKAVSEYLQKEAVAY